VVPGSSGLVVASRVSKPPVPYAELHCHSNFSFLDGASHPEELAEEAARLELDAVALTDHDGFYGIVRFAEAMRSLGLPAVYGAELTLGLEAGPPPAGRPDPPGEHLLVLARDPEGYVRLSSAIGRAQLRGGEKGRPVYDVAELSTAHGGHWMVLTGCRKGAVPRALEEAGPAAAARELARLIEAFGRDSVAVELWDHGDPIDPARNDALVALAIHAGVEPVATNVVHYARPGGHRLAHAVAAVRARRSLDEMDPWLPGTTGAHLRAGWEQHRRFVRWPGVVERAAELGRAMAFDLALVAPRLPDYPVPSGHTEASWLRELTHQGALRRYGPPEAERVPGAWAQIARELDVIEQLGFPGYFLVVHDIVEFCRRRDIYCQGRGSAANSAVCYALGITAADAVALGLLFERFLSPERDGPPDIDVDIESSRRDEVIAYVYARYGRERAAQVANVITYRARSAVRDMGRALGYPEGTLDVWSKQVDRHGSVAATAGATGPDGRADHEIPRPVLELAQAVERFPRHLGVHSGGMVICDRPVLEVCPVEWARREGRTVLQWDKDDCAAVGLVKFDLLGLGMLSALHRMVDHVEQAYGTVVDLALLAQEDEVYEMLARGDSVGVFQVESRAQMATLPRLRPRCFYDLVVEVALIRPGPIQGGSVHPYIRRRNGQEPVTYLHPLLENALGKTLGVPLFQEQLMQMAIDVAGFTAAEADRLRQAMGAKRSAERMSRLRARFYAGMAERGIEGTTADAIWEKMAAFANFGFPESHSVSFAYLVYASAWFKLHYPAAFYAGLLDAQPMGFWSPQSLLRDAARHGVEVRRPHVHASRATTTLEWDLERPAEGSAGRPGPTVGPALRLGLETVRGVRAAAVAAVVAGRPYASLEDLARRTRLRRAELEALATAGALEGLPALAPRSSPGPLSGWRTERRVPAEESCPSAAAWRAGGPGAESVATSDAERRASPSRPVLGRREALWAAGAIADQSGPDRLPGLVTGAAAPPLPPMTPFEEMAADLWATATTPGTHPLAFVRDHLRPRGVRTAQELGGAENGSKVTVAGVVTHRQRPATARGTTFVNLEDETGLINVVFSCGAWVRWRRVARGSPALVVRGRIERVESVVNVVAESVEALVLDIGLVPARDFR